MITWAKKHTLDMRIVGLLFMIWGFVVLIEGILVIVGNLEEGINGYYLVFRSLFPVIIGFYLYFKGDDILMRIAHDTMK
jgi:hypothetical protein